MYLYRAINKEFDLYSYNNKEDIVAKEEKNMDFMKSVAKHVSNGSDPDYQDCWISTTKNFKICASEYAIPQNGGYNTADCEKEIIVIDSFAWRSNTKGYKFNGNFTIFNDKTGKTLLDLGDGNKYPTPKKIEIQGKKSKYIRRYINGDILTRKVLFNQIKVFANIAFGKVDLGLLDLSFKTQSDRRCVPAINEFSLLDYLDIEKLYINPQGYKLKKTLVDKCQKKPIASGIAKQTEEVLVLNRIPYGFIKKKLSKLETTILYALDRKDFEIELKNIIDNKLKVSINETNVSINNYEITIDKDEYKILTTFLVDYACDICKDDNRKDITEEYEKLKAKKRELLERILHLINNEYKVYGLQDDSVIVRKYDLSCESNSNEDNLYDLLAIQDSKTGRVLCYKDKEEFNKEIARFKSLSHQE